MIVKATTLIYKPTGEFVSAMDDGEIGTSSIPQIILTEEATLDGFIRYSNINLELVEWVELVSIEIKVLGV